MPFAQPANCALETTATRRLAELHAKAPLQKVVEFANVCSFQRMDLENFLKFYKIF